MYILSFYVHKYQLQVSEKTASAPTNGRRAIALTIVVRTTNQRNLPAVEFPGKIMRSGNHSSATP